MAGPIKPSIADRLISLVSPRLAADRLKFKAVSSFFVNGGDATGYATSGRSRIRSLRAWSPTARSANEDIEDVRERAIADSRDLYYRNPVAVAALRRCRTNVVGAGLTLQARIDRDVLGLDDETADAWEATAEREFRLWAESTECDASRRLNFAGLQRLVFLSALMNGDAFAMLPPAPEGAPRTVPYRTTVMLIEADRVATPPDKSGAALTVGNKDPRIVAGVELDDLGGPVRYYVRKASSTLVVDPDGYVAVPALAENGRRNILHIMEPDRIGQVRGMPYLTNVVEPLKQITDLSNAELMAAVIAAMFTVFIRSDTGPGALSESFSADASLLVEPDETSGREATSDDNNQIELGPGNVIELGEGQSVDVADAKRPADAFDPFFQAIVRQIGAGLEQPYEVVMLAFTSSYSASRAAIIEAWKFYRERRFWLAGCFCQPVYETVIAEAVAMGRIEAPGFFTDPAIRRAWLGSAWAGPGQGQLDPVKETKGAVARIAGRLSTHEDEYIEIRGGDWPSAMDRLAREERRLEDAGLTASVTAADPDPADDGSQNMNRGDNDANGD